jgi:hypothetical protein
LKIGRRFQLGGPISWRFAIQATSVATSDSAADIRFDHDDDLSDLVSSASRFKFNVAAIALLMRLKAESYPTGDLTR